MYQVKALNSDISKALETDLIHDFVEISDSAEPPNYCILTKKFVDSYLERIKNFKVFEDDIWVVTYPKCGTTWTQEMAWLLNNNLDFENALKVDLFRRFPFVEIGAINGKFTHDTVDECINLSRPRHIKSHLPKFLLPDQLWTVKPKIIYVTRNPKDAVSSFFHHHKYMHDYDGSREDLVRCFLANQLIYSPMNEHVLEFWKMRNEPNIMFIFYEDMKRNLREVVVKTMQFLGKDYSDEEIDKLCQHLSFDSMRNNRTVNLEDYLKLTFAKKGETYDPKVFSFIRKGEVGSHKKELSAEENQKIDAYANADELKKYSFAYKSQ